jgi:hypothetical protein
VRDKPNPEKIILKRIFMSGFKMELFYYVNSRENLWLGVGDKISLIQEHEAREFQSLACILGNKFRILGECNKKAMNLKFKALMAEKRLLEEKDEKSRDSFEKSAKKGD